jgi:SAM-dependent methyltransferase
MFGTPQKVCLAICTPHRKVHAPDGTAIFDTISVPWQRARAGLSMPSNINTFELFADGLEIGDARSRVANLVLNHKPDPPEFLFFLDDDVIAPIDAVTKLFCRARCFPDYDVYAGVYTLKRSPVPEPLIYGEPGQGPIWDWTVGDLLTTERHGVKAVHMGLTLIRTALFRRMLDAEVVSGDGTDQEDEPFYKTVNEERQFKDGKVIMQMGTEDIYFFSKAAKVDCRILVDTSVMAGHYDKATGISYGLPMNYGPAERAKWLGKAGETTDRKEAGDLNLALDIGAGSDRRSWPGHVTYTTDMRPECKPDYVMDTRLLNFPDNHWDMTASNHHLEHLGRWDQETAWKELFRVTKPGGRFEHIVPSLEWAAFKVREGEPDEHVYNVLYGAQEAHGYGRLLNTHFFAYTKDVGRALAEQAGFVDVDTKDWRDDEALRYSLVITGRKPE